MITKVCGLKYRENIQSILNIGIEMIGYNFYPLSSRYVNTFDPSYASLGKYRVGIFVNSTIENIKQKTDDYKLTHIQLHGDESQEFCASIEEFCPVIKVFRVSQNFDTASIGKYEMCQYFLFDTDTKSFGGSGQKFDWSILHSLDIRVPFLVSGGIGPEDVESILSFHHPLFWGIDINSKFEMVPGLKDIGLVNRFYHSLNQPMNVNNNSK